MRFKLSVDKPDQNLVLQDRINFVYPSIRLTYSRSFGNAKLAATRDRSTGSEDEQGRVH